MSERDRFQLYLVLIKLNKLYLALPSLLEGSHRVGGEYGLKDMS